MNIRVDYDVESKTALPKDTEISHDGKVHAFHLAGALQ
jgi:hypothetical protein